MFVSKIIQIFKYLSHFESKQPDCQVLFQGADFPLQVLGQGACGQDEEVHREAWGRCQL